MYIIYIISLPSLSLFASLPLLTYLSLLPSLSFTLLSLPLLPTLCFPPSTSHPLLPSFSLPLQLFVHNFVHGDLHPGNILVQDPSVDDPKLVLLDCGIATSLGPIDLENFHSVFTAIVKGEGAKVADLFLGVQQCDTVDEYRQEMADLVNTSIHNLNLKEV